MTTLTAYAGIGTPTPHFDVTARRSTIRQREHRLGGTRDTQQTPRRQPLTPIKFRTQRRTTRRRRSFMTPSSISSLGTPYSRASRVLCGAQTAPQIVRHKIFQNDDACSSSERSIHTSQSKSPRLFSHYFNDSQSDSHCTPPENSYKCLGLVGSGSFGCVYKAQKLPEGRIYAVKRSRRPFLTFAGQQVLKEVDAIENLMENGATHPHIVQYYESWVSDNHLFLTLEFFEHGTLKDVLTYNSTLSTQQILQIMFQIALGLEFIHMKGVIHLDLKPENIFISNSKQLKIGDFSISVHEDSSSVLDGDGAYVAPELLDSTLGDVTFASDIFSFGVTVFEMLADVEAPSHGEDWDRLRHDDITIPQDRNGDVCHLTRLMMRRTPSERPVATQVKEFCIGCASRFCDLETLSVDLPPIVQCMKDVGWQSEHSFATRDSPEDDVSACDVDDLPQRNLFDEFDNS